MTGDVLKKDEGRSAFSDDSEHLGPKVSCVGGDRYSGNSTGLPGSWGYIAFEVGEVRKRTIRPEEHAIPLGIAAGFSCEGVLINQQVFTKTSNIWGVNNMASGTNTNRIVIFQKS